MVLCLPGTPCSNMPPPIQACISTVQLLPLYHLQEFSTIGKSLVMMTTWLAGNADLNPLYEHAHNPGEGCDGPCGQSGIPEWSLQ